MSQNPNQFSQSQVLGSLDLRFNPNTIPCVVHSTEEDTLVHGQAVKLVDVAGGVPKVVACDADSDEVYGFIVYTVKDKGFVAGDAVEVATAMNCIHLLSQGAIARGAQVCVHSAVDGAVKALTDGAKIVGYALDKASTTGELVRVVLSTPSFSVYTA